MNRIKVFITIAICSMGLTGILYMIDSDPSYPNISTTIIEFSIISGIFFILFSVVYFGKKLLTGTISQHNRTKRNT